MDSKNHIVQVEFIHRPMVPGVTVYPITHSGLLLTDSTGKKYVLEYMAASGDTAIIPTRGASFLTEVEVVNADDAATSAATVVPSITPKYQFNSNNPNFPKDAVWKSYGIENVRNSNLTPKEVQDFMVKLMTHEKLNVPVYSLWNGYICHSAAYFTKEYLRLVNEYYIANPSEVPNNTAADDKFLSTDDEILETLILPTIESAPSDLDVVFNDPKEEERLKEILAASTTNQFLEVMQEFPEVNAKGLNNVINSTSVAQGTANVGAWSASLGASSILTALVSGTVASPLAVPLLIGGSIVAVVAIQFHKNKNIKDYNIGNFTIRVESISQVDGFLQEYNKTYIQLLDADGNILWRSPTSNKTKGEVKSLQSALTELYNIGLTVLCNNTNSSFNMLQLAAIRWTMNPNNPANPCYLHIPKDKLTGRPIKVDYKKSGSKCQIEDVITGYKTGWHKASNGQDAFEVASHHFQQYAQSHLSDFKFNDKICVLPNSGAVLELDSTMDVHTLELGATQSIVVCIEGGNRHDAALQGLFYSNTRMLYNHVQKYEQNAHIRNLDMVVWDANDPSKAPTVYAFDERGNFIQLDDSLVQQLLEDAQRALLSDVEELENLLDMEPSNQGVEQMFAKMLELLGKVPHPVMQELLGWVLSTEKGLDNVARRYILRMFQDSIILQIKNGVAYLMVNKEIIRISENMLDQISPKNIMKREMVRSILNQLAQLFKANDMLFDPQPLDLVDINQFVFQGNDIPLNTPISEQTILDDVVIQQRVIENVAVLLTA